MNPLIPIVLSSAFLFGTDARAQEAGRPVDAIGVRHLDVVVPRTEGGEGTFDALLYCPSGDESAGPAVKREAGPFPAVAFGHGFVQPPERYRATMEALARRGYLVIAPASETDLSPSHRGLANDMRSCLTFLERANADAGSFLRGAVDTAAFGMMGHSMGGGCAILAASMDPRVRALAPLAPAMTSASATDAIARIDAPILIIVGSADSITPTYRHGGPMYKAAGAPKQMLSVAGGFHCGFTDASTFGCDSGAISRPAQQTIVNQALGDFFDLHLKGDETLRAKVWSAEAPAGTTRLMDVGVPTP